MNEKKVLEAWMKMKILFRNLLKLIVKRVLWVMHLKAQMVVLKMGNLLLHPQSQLGHN